ncbi:MULTISPECIES: hypothetical protein [unclassified Saccharibacter]|uniref:hypothetical protein n=1 Tax=unclassified Saccharibacter TaxID=2648722 RepID=UPI00132B8BF8|nr:MULTISPECIES: hypothetical protein [unclassified Saccharibacter]MXV35729.1 hypothetical protein [Saccharibacter sp. EH611]MXV58342.1 hypothetical protein [Saccharibacter sp. EH70]MXV65813.1 hypothetical protein [Saccharibacter sp. EH60]
MKKLLWAVSILTAGLVNVPLVAHAQLTPEQARKSLAKSMGVPESWGKTGFTCGPNGCRQFTPSEVANNPDNSPEVQAMRRSATARLQAEGELHLRRMGMTPETARKGIWATSHKPNSACTRYILQLTGDYDGGFREAYDSDQDLIIHIERSGVCERRNLK